MKIYIVSARVYEDYRSYLEWNVKAFADKAKAEEWRDKAEARAAVLYNLGLGLSLMARVSIELEKQNEFDPNMRLSREDPTKYFVDELEMEN